MSTLDEASVIPVFSPGAHDHLEPEWGSLMLHSAPPKGA